MATVQKKENAIVLKGSAKIVIDYLYFGINSILYQRGLYPSEKFEVKNHYSLPIYVSTDDEIKSFIDSILSQLKDWLLEEKVQKLCMVISNKNTKEVLERWDFKLQYEKADAENDPAAANSANKSTNQNTDEKEKMGNKDIKVIQQEIRDVLRQICSSVSFLPLLDAPCVFDCLAYTKEDTSVPDKWVETEPVFIANSQEVQLRSFSTSLHKMDTVVSYKRSE